MSIVVADEWGTKVQQTTVLNKSYWNDGWVYTLEDRVDAVAQEDLRFASDSSNGTSKGELCV